MFVVVVQSSQHKERSYFAHKGLRDVCMDYGSAAKYRTREKAQGAGLLLAARKPNYIGLIRVISYRGSIKISGDGSIKVPR
jgi:hypothetical protein